MARRTRRQAAEAADVPKFLYVQSALDGDAVAIHEVDDAHPGGSVIVAGDMVVKVGNTPFVQDRLRAGWLEEVSGDRQADEWAKQREAGSIPSEPRRELVNPAAVPTREEVAATGVKAEDVERVRNEVREGAQGAPKAPETAESDDDGDDSGSYDEMTIAEMQSEMERRGMDKMPSDARHADYVKALEENDGASAQG